MSNQYVQLAKNLRTLSDIKCMHGENLYNEYNRGLYNGLELAISILNNKPAKYAKKADKVKRK